VRLRQYQIDCVDSIKQGFKGGTRQLVQLPTGAGKAVILWSYLKDCPGRALIVAPTRELTEQLYETGCDVVGVGLVYLKRGSYFPKNKHVIITTQALAWIL
jgi:superfamily II DNA or RNA helicase